MKKSENLLNRLLEENSEKMDETSSRSFLVSSLNGQTVCRGKNDEFVYRAENQSNEWEDHSVTLPFFATDVNLSARGRYFYAYRSAEENKWVDLFLYDTVLQKEIYSGRIVGASSNITVNDENGEVFYMDNDGLRVIPAAVYESGSSEIKGQLALPASRFSRKYAKVTVNSHLFDFSGPHLLIFYGSAGFYRLYGYNVKSGDFYLIGDRYAKPSLFPVRWSITPSGKKKKNSSPEISAFAYRGNSGQYELRQLNGGAKVAQGRGISTHVLQQPTFISSLNGFFSIYPYSAGFWNPLTDQVIQYPMKAIRYTITDEGILFEAADGRLMIRRTPFSEVELELEQLLRDLSEEEQEN